MSCSMFFKIWLLCRRIGIAFSNRKSAIFVIVIPAFLIVSLFSTVAFIPQARGATIVAIIIFAGLTAFIRNRRKFRWLDQQAKSPATGGGASMKERNAILIRPEEHWKEDPYPYWVLLEDGYYTGQKDKCVYHDERTWSVKSISELVCSSDFSSERLFAPQDFNQFVGQILCRKRLLDEVDAFIQHTVTGNDVCRIS